jgi:chemotaxis methyl-accepting protein methylase
MTDNLSQILDYVKEQRAVDFTVYRQAAIGRRLELRLKRTGISDHASYLEHLKKNPAELDALMDALTIKVSCFFRNPFVFEALSEIVLPEIMENNREDVLRIWSAGCAKGEEVYSAAILVKELIAKEILIPELFILGTDIDRDAIEDAKNAVYKSESLLEVKKGLLDRYFTVENAFYRLNEEIKTMVAFVCHDITTLTPAKEGIFMDYHLILCRNVLIYLDRALCAKVLEYLSCMLQKGGFLILGEAESLLSGAADRFQEVIPKSKVFKKI